MATPADQHDHLLPSQQQQRTQQRSQQQYSQQQQHNTQIKPRSFSVRSDTSHHSGASKPDLHETHGEKESKRLHTKADPTLAINEAEPSMVAAMMTQSFHVPLRSIQHKDAWGNPIADPDRSNPTRNRWERPLDTIRGFEAAIEGAYSRKTMYRSESDSVANWNSRGSFQPPNQPRFPQDSYYGSRPASFRTDNQYGPMNGGTARSSVFDSQGLGNGGGHHNNNGYGRAAPRERGQRMPSESHYQVYGREASVYPMPHKDRSYETVTSAAPSGNSDPAGYQTDPTSSDNSSIERMAPAKRQEPVNDYGIGFSPSQAYQAPNFSVGMATTSSHNDDGAEAAQYDLGPAVPLKESVGGKQARPESGEKRRSWFSRRFSKNS